jgi:lipoate-protein ligase B
MSSNEVCFYDLGLIEYREAHIIMLNLLQKRIANEIGDTVLLLEHFDVYTLGRKGVEENVIDRTIPVYRVERGGDATYHGPGQLVAYPIVSLTALGLGVADFVHLLEEACIRLLKGYGVDAGRVEGKPGVWVGGKKIASIGLAVKNWVTYHGIALNVNTDLTKFYGIKPCGMDAETMTSMERVLGRKVSITEVKKAFAFELARLLDRVPVLAASGIPI